MTFSSGGVSHVDAFDYKPELVKRDSQPLPVRAGIAEAHEFEPLLAFISACCPELNKIASTA
jgi:hypothetical protein